MCGSRSTKVTALDAGMAQDLAHRQAIAATPAPAGAAVRARWPDAQRLVIAVFVPFGELQVAIEEQLGACRAP